ncbi:hypothetical protein OFB79_26670, partial [Escherichia coli]|nr:hypothetical protein [Escherichia coli]
VKLLDNLDPCINRQLRVQHTAANAKLLEKQLQAVRAIDIRHKHQTGTLDQLQLEDQVADEPLVMLDEVDVKVGEVLV